jgi:hypothetical protein
MSIAFSVDLEPNKDGSFDGVKEAMNWFDAVVPRGTVYATYRVANEHPDLVDSLATDHEIGAHIHPREFGHDHDQFARLEQSRQRELIKRTRTAIAVATGCNPVAVTAFRAGRHSASLTTLSVLTDLGFTVDASTNVNYDTLPAELAHAQEPIKLENGLVELPTSYYRPSLFSADGLRRIDNRTITATASTLREDSLLCSGLRALRMLFASTDGVISMYMHPYDATEYHEDLVNVGQPFRDRIERLFTDIERFVSASDITDY